MRIGGLGAFPSFLSHLTLCRSDYSAYKRVNEELELMYKLEISN